MNKFARFLEKYDVNIHDIKNSYDHSTFVKWKSGASADPKNSTMKIFMELFGHKFNYNFKELSLT